MPADEFSFDITPQDAIDYLKKRRKTELSWHWSDVQKQEHMRAFTVAKMTSATLLDDVRKSLDKAMAEGQSFQEWRKDIIPKLQGVWLGKTYGDLWDSMTPAEQAGKTAPTPEERDRVIKASRLETIFRTNMFNAYAAGRYRQLKEDADIYPYWRYVTAKDSAVRPAHRALEGKVFKADDPFWSTHYPPNGFNCRCIVEAVDEYDLEMQDLKVQEGGNTYFDEENGQAVYRDAEGKEYPCDKGWDYNVGEDPTGQKTLAAKKFPPELAKAIGEDLKAEAKRLKAEAKELEKARKQAEEESRRADAVQKAAEQAKKQAEAEAKRKAQEQRKAQAEAERKAKEQSQKAETEQKRFVVDVTRPSKPSKHPGKKAAAEEQKRFVVDVTRPDVPSKHPGKKATADEQQFTLINKFRKLNEKLSKQHKNEGLAEVEGLSNDEEHKRQNCDFIKIGDKSYSKSRIFTEATCGAEAIIRSVEEKHIIRVQNAPLDCSIIDMFDFRNIDGEQIYHISQAEKLVKDKALEYVFFYDSSGKVLFGAIGTRHFLAVSRLGLRKSDLAGLNCLHNHPGGSFNFSLDDMESFLANKPQEARLVTSVGVLSFQPNYPMLINIDYVTDIFSDIKIGVERELREKYPELYKKSMDIGEQGVIDLRLKKLRQTKTAEKFIKFFHFYGKMDIRAF